MGPGPWGALGEAWGGGWGVGSGVGVAGPLVPIGPIDPLKRILLWILTCVDPQDPVLSIPPAC